MAFLFAGAPPASSRAASIDGMTFPSTMTADGHVLHLNGVGLRTVTLFRIHAYVAALYLEHPDSDTDAIETSTGPKVLILEYLRGASKETVQRMFRQSATQYCAAASCPAGDKQDFERLIARLPAVKRGDYTTYLLSPRKVQVLINNAPLISFDDSDLGRRLLDAFIGPHAVSLSLRTALLGHPEG